MARLSAAKAAFLDLDPGEQAEFRAFLAQQEEPSSTAWLRLSRGTGKRACHNGKLANLIVGSQRCGWVDVKLEGSNDAVSWRSGAWKVMPAHTAAQVNTTPATVPADAIGLILAKCSLAQRLRALAIAADWASCASAADVWSSLCTPLEAKDFTAKRLIMLLQRAGDRLQILDVGCDAGRTGGTGRVLSVEEWDVQNPLSATLLSLAAANKFARLHTLRIRYMGSWMDGKILADLCPQCPALQELYVGPIHYNAEREAHALAVPSLVSLHLNLNQLRARDGAVTLPLCACTALHTLSLVNFIRGHHHFGDVFTDQSRPLSLRCLRLSVPSGGLVNFEPALPRLETLYLRTLKTGGQMVSCVNLPNLQALHIDASVYGQPRLARMYRSLYGCVSLRYLRVELASYREEHDAEEEDEPSDDGEEDEELSNTRDSNLAVVMQHPDMWFCQVPHDVALPAGWERKALDASSRGWTLRDNPRLMVKVSASHYDAAHIRKLENSTGVLMPCIQAIDSHPDAA